MIVRIIPCLRTLSPRLKHAVVLGLILLFGAVLRFRHLGWARGYYFQPDESVHTIDYLLRLPASLNPYEVGPYTYGGLPLYLYYFSAQALSRITSDPIWMDKWHVTLVARTYAATASTITIALIYTLWRRLGTAHVGWVSALALAVSPLSVQYAHYGVVDTLLTFWAVLATWLSVEAWMRNHPAYWAMAGLALGLAVATKSSGLIWALVFVVAALGYWARTHNWRAILRMLALGGIGILIGVPVRAMNPIVQTTERITARRGSNTPDTRRKMTNRNTAIVATTSLMNFIMSRLIVRFSVSVTTEEPAR